MTSQSNPKQGANEANGPTHIVRSPLSRIAEANVLAHPLNQQARRRAVSLGDLAGLTSIGVHLNVVAPGDVSTEHHRHDLLDEFVYILSGEATVYLDKEEYKVTAGDFIGFPAHGPAHSMRNIGTSDLVYLVGGGRANVDICHYPNLEKRLYISTGPEGRRRELFDVKDVQDF
jgi:uncharacterized cupin superfamily protein